MLMTHGGRLRPVQRYVWRSRKPHAQRARLVHGHGYSSAHSRFAPRRAHHADERLRDGRRLRLSRAVPDRRELPRATAAHAHDLFSEAALTYSTQMSRDASAFVYVGSPGEPALGPPTYMHHLIAYDMPDAPIGHHWEDSTHITFGVVTAGVTMKKVKFEASTFTGREPNEIRTNFDPVSLDSVSGRVSWNPTANLATQVSYGYTKSPKSRRCSISTGRRRRSSTTNRSRSASSSPPQPFEVRTSKATALARTRTYWRRTIAAVLIVSMVARSSCRKVATSSYSMQTRRGSPSRLASLKRFSRSALTRWDTCMIYHMPRAERWSASVAR